MRMLSTVKNGAKASWCVALLLGLGILDVASVVFVFMMMTRMMLLVVRVSMHSAIRGLDVVAVSDHFLVIHILLFGVVAYMVMGTLLQNA